MTPGVMNNQVLWTLSHRTLDSVPDVQRFNGLFRSLGFKGSFCGQCGMFSRKNILKYRDNPEVLSVLYKIRGL